MKYFQLHDKIDTPTLDKFIEFMNLNDGEITVIINNNGGEAIVAQSILYIINSNSERIILQNALCMSCAFDIFFRANCRKQLLNGCIGMFHLYFNKQIGVDQLNNYIYDEDKCHLKNNEAYSFIHYCKDFMTPQEYIKFCKSKDVFFTFERMKQIFPEAEII